MLGLLVIMFAVEGFIVPSYLEEWGELLLGLALILAPWAIGYEPGSATVSSVISGLLVILFAAWELATDREFITKWLRSLAPPSDLRTDVTESLAG